MCNRWTNHFRCFFGEVSLAATVDDIKQRICTPARFPNIAPEQLSLWKWSILPDADDGKTPVEVKDLDNVAELHRPKALLSSLSLDDNTYIIVQLPQQGMSLALDGLIIGIVC